MKIALVHPKFDLSGGAERYCLGLAAGLAGAGHDVHLYARRVDGVPSGCTVHPVGALPLGRAVKTWSFCSWAGRAVGKSWFDVVQGFGKTSCQTVHRTGGGVHRAYLDRVVKRSPGWYDRVVLRIEDALFASPHLRAVICPSRWVAGEVARFYPSAQAKLRVVPNGVDIGVFTPTTGAARQSELRARLSIPPEAPLLLFVATNFRLKGLPHAIEALARLPSARLLVAGGDEPRGFVALAQARGVGERVHFLGAVGRLETLYPAVDLLVHPTSYDPFANVCLEALACGTPVVTTDADGASDLLTGGPEGVVVPLRACPEGLAPAVAALLAAGEGAREAARRCACAHRLEAHVTKVLDVYRSLADGIPGGGR